MNRVLLAIFLIVSGLGAEEPQASDVAPKAGISQVDKKLQLLFDKIRRLQTERETLESLIEEKDEQLENLQDQVIVLLKERDFYEQQLGEPENEADSPYQP